ncbi:MULTISPECIES: hypothetical protein [Streptomyces]|uniref:hypothetical protein n=1 Tax=Streptomyces TaxID=1883 RepID=UPI000F3A9CB3|nr:hypothetical protein [Streptomyces sp. ADI95-16]
MTVQHPVHDERVPTGEKHGDEVFLSHLELVEEGSSLADSGFGVRPGHSESQTHSQRGGAPVAGVCGQFGEDLLLVPSGGQHFAGLQDQRVLAFPMAHGRRLQRCSKCGRPVWGSWVNVRDDGAGFSGRAP